MAKRATPVTICDMCREALTDDDTETAELSEAEQDGLLVEMGADIADHLCEKREYGSPCDCGCNHR